MLKEQILTLFHGRLRSAIEAAVGNFDNLQEIRIRAGQPVIFIQNGEEILLYEHITLKDIKSIIEAACGYSGYAYEEEISRGYLTIEGGHRIGLTGRAVFNGQKIQTIKHISGLAIRVAHPVVGCADPWKSYLYQEIRPCHVLIISPPGCGKTTLLRDIIRLFSNGDDKRGGLTVGVVDERSEIAGTYRGMITHDLGMRTDVLDGCPKVYGMEMLVRSMAPKVLAVDEIGTGDVAAIENALRCGCHMLSTMHGETMADFLEKPGFASLADTKVFERYIFLKPGEKPGQVAAIYGQNFEILWEDACT